MLQSAFNAGIRPAWFVADEVYSRTLFVLHWSLAQGSSGSSSLLSLSQACSSSFQEFSVFNKFFATQPVYLQPTKHLLLSALNSLNPRQSASPANSSGNRSGRYTSTTRSSGSTNQPILPWRRLCKILRVTFIWLWSGERIQSSLRCIANSCTDNFSRVIHELTLQPLPDRI